MKFKRIDTTNGRVMYWADGEMVSKIRIPEHILTLLDPGVELDVATELIGEAKKEIIKDEPKKQIKIVDKKRCVFGDKPSTHEKFLYGQAIGLCDKHYRETTGRIGQEMKTLGYA